MQKAFSRPDGVYGYSEGRKMTYAQKEQFLWQRMFAKGIIVCLLLLSLLLSNVVYKNEMSGMVARKQELLDFQKELFLR